MISSQMWEELNKVFLLVRDAKSPAHAAAILNQKIFGLVNVKYSTQRPKADQSPAESIKAGLASCSGLTVLLIDACRAVGVPARFVGTPLWSDNSGNHSWAEVWDQGWHFTGAAEPSGDQLDQAWFVARASTAQRDHRLHAIYAVSFQKTPIIYQSFSLLAFMLMLPELARAFSAASQRRTATSRWKVSAVPTMTCSLPRSFGLSVAAFVTSRRVMSKRWIQ